MEKEHEDQTRTRRDTNVGGADESEPRVGYRTSSGARRSEGEAPGTAESGRNPGSKESSPLHLGGNRDRRERDRKGGWANSYEGSAAKRRADEVLARIAALEVSFDRVEERAVATPPANVVRGGGASELRTARNDAASALDAPPAAGAATSNVAPMLILGTAGEALTFVVCLALKQLTSRPVRGLPLDASSLSNSRVVPKFSPSSTSERGRIE